MELIIIHKVITYSYRPTSKTCFLTCSLCRFTRAILPPSSQPCNSPSTVHRASRVFLPYKHAARLHAMGPWVVSRCWSMQKWTGCCPLWWQIGLGLGSSPPSLTQSPLLPRIGVFGFRGNRGRRGDGGCARASGRGHIRGGDVRGASWPCCCPCCVCRFSSRGHGPGVVAEVSATPNHSSPTKRNL
jgi:hypothetical protein